MTEPEIPNNPYPPGDPRGWIKFQDCRTDLCAAQRQHTTRCQQDDPTFDPAALDLDAIFERAVQYRANQMQHAKTYDRATALTAAAFLCAQDVPPLIKALAAAREELAEAQREEGRYRQEARDSATTAGRALRELREARAEADKLRAELDEPKATGGVVTSTPVIGEDGCINYR